MRMTTPAAPTTEIAGKAPASQERPQPGSVREAYERGYAEGWRAAADDDEENSMGEMSHDDINALAYIAGKSSASQERPHDNHDGCNPYDEGHVAGKAGRSTPAEALDVDTVADAFRKMAKVGPGFDARIDSGDIGSTPLIRPSDLAAEFVEALSPHNREADHD